MRGRRRWWSIFEFLYPERQTFPAVVRSGCSTVLCARDVSNHVLRRVWFLQYFSVDETLKRFYESRRAQCDR